MFKGNYALKYFAGDNISFVYVVIIWLVPYNLIRIVYIHYIVFTVKLIMEVYIYER